MGSEYAWIFFAAIAIVAIAVFSPNRKKSNDKTDQKPKSKSKYESPAEYELPAEKTIPLPPEQEEKDATPLNLNGAYQSKWMFTYNEKGAYWKLKTIAEKKGYTVFAKVRLLDLLEPVKGNPKYKTFFYKVQAKHVDFVLCDQKLVARTIIELDDSSHDSPDRIERDKFVDEVLQKTGYKIIHTRSITDDILD